MQDKTFKTTSIYAFAQQRVVVMTGDVITKQFSSGMKLFDIDTSFYNLIEAEKTLRWLNYNYDDQDKKINTDRSKEVLMYTELLNRLRQFGLDPLLDVSNPLETPIYNRISKQSKFSEDLRVEGRKAMVGRIFVGLRENIKQYYQLYFIKQGDSFNDLESIVAKNYDEVEKEQILELFQIAVE